MGSRDGADWVRYWGARERSLEAMYAHFTRHAYYRHSHDTYSFGVTEDGAQAFTCRGERHVNGAGMVLAFNPDDPHDGWAPEPAGFTYRIVHIEPNVVADVLSDLSGRRVGLPLFAQPSLTDPTVALGVRRLHVAVAEGAPEMAVDERLADLVGAMVHRHGSARPGRGSWPEAPAPLGGRPARSVAERVRDLVAGDYLADLPAEEIAAAAGCSRYAAYRAFRSTFGLAPSEFQRLLRLREARRLLAAGRTPADAAVEAGFADQAHLTRWFVRCYGITPAAYRRQVSRYAEPTTELA